MSVRIAMALLIAMIAAGCFGGDGTSEESTEATSVEPEPVGESASAQEEREGAPSAVVSDDSLRVCCRFEGEEIPPYYECPSVGCRPRGFDPELMELVAEELDVDWSWVELEGHFEDDPRLVALEEGKADISVMLITVTEDRARRVHFTDSYLDTGLGALVRADGEVRTPEDLAGRDVFVAPDTTPEDWLAAEQPDARAVQRLTGPYRGPVTLVDMLMENDIDAYINDWRHVAHLSENFDGVAVFDEVLVDEELAIAVSPHAEHWKAKLNAALGELEQDGSLPALREKWFGDEF